MRFKFLRRTRRAMRLAGAGRPRSSARVMRRAISAAVVKASVAPLSTLYAMTTGKPSSVRKRPKAVAKAPRKAASRADEAQEGRSGAALKQLRGARVGKAGRLLPGCPVTPSGSSAKSQRAQHLRRTYSGPAGARDFQLFLPARQPDGPTGLIVMLHGCSQDPDDFATGTDMNAVAQRHGLAVAWPAQTSNHNGASCWNWFSPANQARGAGEPAVIAGLARGLMREFGLKRKDVFVAGLSAGGAMAVILAETYPDVFSAAGVHSGLAHGAARNVMSAMRRGGSPSAMPRHRCPAAGTGKTARRIVFHGDADSAVHPSNAPQIVRAAVGSRTAARVTPASAAGRDYLRTEYALPDGTVDVELWQVSGGGHAWSGGKSGGTFTDPRGPDASAEMVRFFLSPPA